MNEHSKRYHFFISVAVQFGVIGVCIALHRLFIGRGELVTPSVIVNGVATQPTSGRLVFLILCVTMFFVLTFLASKRARKGEQYLPFILGMFSGTFLWQVLGEDCWHFSIDGVNIIQMESIAALPIFILFVSLLVYAWRTRCFDWGVQCSLLAFAVNWFGHYVLMGLHPIFSGIVSEGLYMHVAGLGVGSILLVVGLVFGLRKNSSEKQRILAGILCFFAIALIAFSLIYG